MAPPRGGAPYGEKLYHTLAKKRVKIKGKGEKSMKKWENLKGKTEKNWKNKEKEIKNFKNCPIKLEHFRIFLQKELFYR